MTEPFYPSHCHEAPSRRRFLALGAAAILTGASSRAAGAQGRDGVDIIRQHAASAKDPWGVAHGLRAMGADFTIEGGRRAVDFLLEEHVTSVTVNGQTALAFPLQVEAHPNMFLKTLLEAGVRPDYRFNHRGHRRTVGDLVEGARLLFRPQEIAAKPNRMPWSIIALTLTTSPLRARWTNAYGEPVDLEAVVGNALDTLERVSAPVTQAMREGRPLAAKAPVHELTCGGTHLIYSLVTAAYTGHASNGQAPRIRQQLDVLVWRLGADIDLIDRFYAQQRPTGPISPWLSLDAKLKVLGHAEECLALATHRKVMTLSAPQQAMHRKAVAEVRDLLAEIDTRGLAEIRSMGEIRSPESQIYRDTYRQVVGDVCHARHGLTLS